MLANWSYSFRGVNMNKKFSNRRKFLKLGATSLVAAPFANIMVNGVAQAADLPQLEESDPVAMGLKYKHDAAASERTDDTATCANCQLYTEPDAEWGPCAIFAGKSVNAAGWCASWTKRTT